jgi:hypothetical protein
VIISLYNKNDSNFKNLQTKKYLDFCDWSILVCIFFYGYNRLPEGISLINEIKSQMNNFRLTTHAINAKAEPEWYHRVAASHYTTNNPAPTKSMQKELSNLEVGCLPCILRPAESSAVVSSTFDSGNSTLLRREVFNSDIYKQDLHLPLVLSILIKNLPHYKSEGYSATILDKISYLFSLPSPYEIKNGVRYLRGTTNFVSEKLKIIAIGPMDPLVAQQLQSNNSFTYSSLTECSKALKIGRTNIKNCILSGKTYKNYKFILANNS